MSDREVVLECSICGTGWNLEELFLDPDLRLNGYQAALRDPMKGLILLTHARIGCQTTLSLRVSVLAALAEREELPLLAGHDGCPGHCQDDGDLESCPLECSMSWVRTLLDYIRVHRLPPGLCDTE